MRLKKFLVLLLNCCINLTNSDWVKLPEIRVESSSPARRRPIILKSDVMSAVFGLQVVDDSTTSERTTAVLSNPDLSQIFSSDRRNLFSTSTVTPKIIAYHSSSEHNIANMKPVKLFTAAAAESEKTMTTRVAAAARSNRTYSIEISPIITTRANLSDLHVVDDGNGDVDELESVEAVELADDRKDEYDEDQGDEEEDDGVTISDEEADGDVGGGDEMNTSWESEKSNHHDSSDEFRDDEYLDESEEELSPATTLRKTSTTTSTTVTPLRRRLKSPTTPKRRMYTTSERPKQQQSNSSPLSFSNFMNFLKKIQNSFATRTAKSIGEKILILKRFRDSLIQSINRQIENLWKFRGPNDGKAELKAEHKKKKRVHRVQKRFAAFDAGTGGGGGWVDTSHGSGMAFPSAESALLSICFLTFAVFLIKLVLQVIHIIKMKKYAYATQMNSVEIASVIKRHRNARKASFSDQNQLMDMARAISGIESLKVLN